MNDNWDDEFMPDDGDYGITLGEAARDVAVFLAKVLGAVLVAAIVVGWVAYCVWREAAIFNLLSSF